MPNSYYIPNEYEKIAENFAGHDRPMIETRLRINPYRVILVVWALLMFFGFALITDAQDNAPYADCANLIPFDVSGGNDLTELLLEGYQVYATDPVRYDEITDLFLEALGGGIKNPIRFYNMAGSWVIVYATWNKKLALWAGANWDIGDDLQLHYGANEPACYVVIENTRQTRSAIRQYPQCTYPYYCE